MYLRLDNICYENYRPVLTLLGTLRKSIGQIIRVSAAMHVLFDLDVAGPTDPCNEEDADLSIDDPLLYRPKKELNNLRILVQVLHKLVQVLDTKRAQVVRSDPDKNSIVANIFTQLNKISEVCKFKLYKNNSIIFENTVQLQFHFKARCNAT